MSTEEVFAVRWLDEGAPAVQLLDQTRLPAEYVTVECRDVETLAEAIRSLRVRGAPALGVAGAYGVVLGALVDGDPDGAARTLAGQRPTAVNLSWACDRVRAAGLHPPALLAEARAIDRETQEACAAIGRHGAMLLTGGANLLTHCNTGTLACQGIGTAFGIARTLYEQGGLRHLWVDETRPLLQGSRLTAFEALALGMPHAVIPDGAAASVIARGEVDAIFVGADRIAANGDTANKIGTYMLAVLADRHGVAFYVAAPTSTVDHDTPDGSYIVIEQRDPDEVRTASGTALLTPPDSPAHNPAFDVTPASLVTAIITEVGVARPPYAVSLPGMTPPPGRGPAVRGSSTG